MSEKVLPVVFYVALVIWTFSVGVNIWTAWSQTAQFSSQGSELHARLQLVVSAIGAAWGYLLVAVVALSATEFLRTRD